MDAIDTIIDKLVILKNATLEHLFRIFGILDTIDAIVTIVTIDAIDAMDAIVHFGFAQCETMDAIVAMVPIVFLNKRDKQRLSFQYSVSGYRLKVGLNYSS